MTLTPIEREQAQLARLQELRTQLLEDLRFRGIEFDGDVSYEKVASGLPNKIDELLRLLSNGSQIPHAEVNELLQIADTAFATVSDFIRVSDSATLTDDVTALIPVRHQSSMSDTVEFGDVATVTIESTV